MVRESERQKSKKWQREREVKKRKREVKVGKRNKE